MLKGPRVGVAGGLALLFVVIAIATIGFMAIEHWSFLDSVYMTVLTISTVGYGEVHPLSHHGRVFASAVIVLGLGSAFFTTTMLGRVILEAEFRGNVVRRTMKRRIDGLHNHIIVCGYGRTGSVVAQLLDKEKHAFCVIENQRDKEEELKDASYTYLIGDATEVDLLVEAGVKRAGSVMALLPSDADNLYLTMAAKEANPKVLVVARAFDPAAEMRLKRAGADHVIATHKIAAHRVFQAAVRPTIEEFVDLVTDRQQLSLIVEEARLCSGSEIAGRSIKDAGVRTRYGVIIVTIKKASGEMIFNPDASVVLVEGDTIVAIGEKSNLDRLITDCQSKSPG
jgi:voltage-gated potassium channel